MQYLEQIREYNIFFNFVYKVYDSNLIISSLF